MIQGKQTEEAGREKERQTDRKESFKITKGPAPETIFRNASW